MPQSRTNHSLARTLSEPDATARRIAETLLRRRRPHPSDSAQGSAVSALLGALTADITPAVLADEPLRLALVGFSFKSPAVPQRTFGPDADLADRLALEGLADLCAELEGHHPAGVILTIYSDGLGANRVLGVPDDHVMRYAAGVRRLLGQVMAERGMREDAIRYVTLDQMLGTDADGVLERLHEAYRAEVGLAPSEKDTHATFRAILEGRPDLLAHYRHLAAYYRGEIHDLLEAGRFVPTPWDMARLVSEGLASGEAADTIALDRLSLRGQRACGSARAAEILRLVMGVRRIVAEAAREERTIRLSIHATPVHMTGKLGIRLMAGEADGPAPWHGVAVTGTGSESFVTSIVRRSVAETMGVTVARDPRTGLLCYMVPAAPRSHQRIAA